MPIITQQELIDAAADAKTLEDVANGAADLGGDGLVHPRTGGDLKTLAKIQEEIETLGLGWLALAEAWANEDEDVVVSGGEYSAKHYSLKSQASANAAASSAAEGLYRDVVSKVYADSPIVPTALEEGTLFRIDTSGGNVVINLDELSNYGEDMIFAFVKVTSDSNTVTINRGGSSDLIEGATSEVISVQYSVTVFIGDSATGTWLTAIQTTGIPDDAITTPKIIDEAVTEAKIDPDAIISIRKIPQNSKSAAYTLVAADGGGHILHPSADTTARVWTIPANASVAFPIGTAITFVNQDSAGEITIAITTDTMRLAGDGATGSRTLAANGVATALKITSTEWIISGTGLT